MEAALRYDICALRGAVVGGEVVHISWGAMQSYDFVHNTKPRERYTMLMEAMEVESKREVGSKCEKG